MYPDKKNKGSDRANRGNTNLTRARRRHRERGLDLIWVGKAIFLPITCLLILVQAIYRATNKTSNPRDN